MSWYHITAVWMVIISVGLFWILPDKRWYEWLVISVFFIIGLLVLHTPGKEDKYARKNKDI